MADHKQYVSVQIYPVGPEENLTGLPVTSELDKLACIQIEGNDLTIGFFSLSSGGTGDNEPGISVKGVQDHILRTRAHPDPLPVRF
jgi:hypothetical protein